MNTTGLVVGLLVSTALAVCIVVCVVIAAKSFIASRPCSTPDAWRNRAFGWHMLSVCGFFALALIACALRMTDTSEWLAWLLLPACLVIVIGMSAGEGADRKSRKAMS
jgi:cell division protein FtsW (lipid II flippase)